MIVRVFEIDIEPWIFSDMPKMKPGSKPAAEANPSPSTRNQPTASGPVRNKPGQAQKKKKRSGKFWSYPPSSFQPSLHSNNINNNSN